ncbi:fasciclin domain-containing protein [Microbacterium esteraromaticum]|uniref:fasciclin domain-containing protein n=1 Tax=Microbacterium esteraromaticum TaxID=57043 RepID=UPI001A907549|nr:fasciclin domain-containing protein [Microbacterium esteraromaticum]MBN8425548.1 fasciclin domain-containing protein [Microbacterium esteraromaticum]
MLSTKKKTTAALAIGFAGVLLLAGCSAGSDTESASTEPEAPATSEEATDDMMDPAANLVGPGCAAYAEQVPDGDGSIQGMSQDPVAVAASNNPLLTTLVSAVSGQLNPDVNLVDTLNGDEFTVFAPVDDAFAKIDPATIEALKTDADTLSSILTYHVVPGQIEPADIAGMHTTVQGSDLEVTGSGEEWMVNDANVICGGVQTANATVYLIDSVLLPTE